jgi:hypothetical protein
MSLYKSVRTSNPKTLSQAEGHASNIYLGKAEDPSKQELRGATCQPPPF